MVELQPEKPFPVVELIFSLKKLVFSLKKLVFATFEVCFKPPAQQKRAREAPNFIANLKAFQ